MAVSQQARLVAHRRFVDDSLHYFVLPFFLNFWKKLPFTFFLLLSLPFFIPGIACSFLSWLPSSVTSSATSHGRAYSH